MPDPTPTHPLTADGFGEGSRAVSDAWERLLDASDASTPTPTPTSLPVWAWTPSPASAVFGPALGGGYLELRRCRDGAAGLVVREEESGEGAEEAEVAEAGPPPPPPPPAAAAEEAPADGDPAALPLPPPHPTRPAILLEAHAVWAPSFRAPALYLRGVRQGARGGGAAAAAVVVVGVADLERLAFRGSDAGAAPEGLLAPAEHPHLGGPWAVLHPCHTAGWMGAMMVEGGGEDGEDDGRPPSLPSPASYMAAWLSVVSPMLGVGVPAGLGAAVSGRTG